MSAYLMFLWCYHHCYCPALAFVISYVISMFLLVVLFLSFFSQQEYFALGSGQTITLKTLLLNSGDDAFLPRLTLRFPSNIQYIKVLQNVS